jgi:hypothetical protein
MVTFLCPSFQTQATYITKIKSLACIIHFWVSSTKRLGVNFHLEFQEFFENCVSFLSFNKISPDDVLGLPHIFLKDQFQNF